MKTIVDGKERPLEGLYFRIHADRITGHRGVSEMAAHPHRATVLQRLFGRDHF